MIAPEDDPRDELTEEEFWRGCPDGAPTEDDDCDDIDPDEIPSL